VVDTGDLRTTLEAYGTGLEAELSLLRQLHRLALQARPVGRFDYDLLVRISDERRRLMTSLLTIEDQIRPLRETIAAHLADAARLPGFGDVSALHKVASHLVTLILGTDEETVRALREADVARRAAAQILEQAEATLAAYRRVVAPPSRPALVSRCG
jgi:hypothetical protein